MRKWDNITDTAGGKRFHNGCSVLPTHYAVKDGNIGVVVYGLWIAAYIVSADQHTSPAKVLTDSTKNLSKVRNLASPSPASGGSDTGRG